MSFSQKIKKASFWRNFLKIFIPFFIVLCIITLLFDSWSDVFDGNFEEIQKLHFANGRWIRFFSTKLVISFFYSLYVTSKNTK